MLKYYTMYMEVKDYNLLTPECRVPVSKVNIRKEKATGICNVHHVEVKKVWEDHLSGMDDYIAELEWEGSGGFDDDEELLKRTWRKWLSKDDLLEFISEVDPFEEDFQVDLKYDKKYLVYNVPSYETQTGDFFKLGFYSDHNILDYFSESEINWAHDDLES